MDVKSNIKYSLFFTLVSLCLLNSCALLPRPGISFDSEKDIVFIFWDGNRNKNGNIMLMNADGTAVEPVGNGTEEIMPVWSPDKENILTLSPRHRERLSSIFGFMVVSGRSACSGTFFYGRMRWATNSEIITVRTGANSFHPKIVFWDVFRCDTTKVIYEEDTFDGFWDPDISIDENVVFSRSTEGGEWITIYHQEDGRVAGIEKGIGATWSPDGMQIVFTGAEGLYFSDGEGRSIQKAVDLTGYYPVIDGSIEYDEWPPMAVWSPDGRFLLFHRRNRGKYELVKFEIATELETVIYQGGMYPDWR